MACSIVMVNAEVLATQGVYMVFISSSYVTCIFPPHSQEDHVSWWRHQMETFSASLALCAGNSPVPVNSPHKGQWRGALTFFMICALNKRLSKKSQGWWFETLTRSLWRHCNVVSLSSNMRLQIDCLDINDWNAQIWFDLELEDLMMKIYV